MVRERERERLVPARSVAYIMLVPNRKESSILLLRGSCKFHTIGIGSKNMQASTTMSMTPIEIKTAIWSRQCPPGMLGSQRYAMGVQLTHRFNDAHIPQAMFRAITACAAML